MNSKIKKYLKLDIVLSLVLFLLSVSLVVVLRDTIVIAIFGNENQGPLINLEFPYKFIGSSLGFVVGLVILIYYKLKKNKLEDKIWNVLIPLITSFLFDAVILFALMSLLLTIDIISFEQILFYIFISNLMIWGVGTLLSVNELISLIKSRENENNSRDLGILTIVIILLNVPLFIISNSEVAIIIAVDFASIVLAYYFGRIFVRRIFSF